MDLTSIKFHSSTTDISHTSSLSAKIRRLQIEESLLLQSINKCAPEDSQKEIEIEATRYTALSEFNTFSTKSKNSFKEIKLLFQDLKTSTSTKETLKSLDIDDVKRSTLELENSIKTFKSYIQSELDVLKSAEHKLNQTLNENPVSINKLKNQLRLQTVKYNEIVPSPVKTIINSPFKSLEVQKFQEFMMHSANRYGGWNEYHHNIFVNHWQKHFGSQINIYFNETEDTVENSLKIHVFSHELLPKLKDISEEEIISHVEWYLKYIYLKERQQKAIDKWRSNRKVMKSAKVKSEEKKECNIRRKSNGRKSTDDYIDNNRSVSDEPSIIQDLISQSLSQGEVSCFVRKCLSDEDHIFKNINNAQNNVSKGCVRDRPVSNFQKSTKQWHNNVNSKNIKIETKMNNLENIQKLRIPTWRGGL